MQADGSTGRSSIPERVLPKRDSRAKAQAALKENFGGSAAAEAAKVAPKKATPVIALLPGAEGAALVDVQAAFSALVKVRSFPLLLTLPCSACNRDF